MSRRLVLVLIAAAFISTVMMGTIAQASYSDYFIALHTARLTGGHYVWPDIQLPPPHYYY